VKNRHIFELKAPCWVLGAEAAMLVGKVEDVRKRRRLKEKLRQLRKNLERRHAQVASA
jgi:hypothetical protein